jgi:hypothetical protein
MSFKDLTPTTLLSVGCLSAGKEAANHNETVENWCQSHGTGQGSNIIEAAMNEENISPSNITVSPAVLIEKSIRTKSVVARAAPTEDEPKRTRMNTRSSAIKTRSTAFGNQVILG